MGGAQSEETGGAKVTESTDQGVEGDAQANRTEHVTSLEVRSLLSIIGFSCYHWLPSGCCIGIVMLAVYVAGTE